jgi:serine/threonine protein kinase
MQRLIRIMVQLVLGVELLHRSKILHRDLKPDNVFVDADDNVKIGWAVYSGCVLLVALFVVVLLLFVFVRRLCTVVYFFFFFS